MTARIERPLSPHLQTYRVTMTMALSIVHRGTGIALYFGTLLLAWWLIAAASGPGAYANVQAFTSSFVGRLRRYRPATGPSEWDDLGTRGAWGGAVDRAALHYSNIDPEYRRRERAV